MTTKTKKWLHAFGSAGITGFATSFTSALGIQGAQMVGINIQTLDAKQILVMTLFGGLVGMAAYLKQSPLPDLTTGDTETFTKPPTG